MLGATACPHCGRCGCCCSRGDTGCWAPKTNSPTRVRDERRRDLLLDAVASKRLLLGVDGVDEVADMTKAVTEWIFKDLVPMRLRCVVTSSAAAEVGAPSALLRAAEASSTWRILDLLPPTRAEQMQALLKGTKDVLSLSQGIVHWKVRRA